MDVLKTKVEIRHFSVMANVGCTDMERESAQEIVFDIDVFFDGRKSMESDNIDDAVDYMDVKNIVLGICKENRPHLLEHLGLLISQKIYDTQKIADEIHLTIKKPAVMPQSKYAAVGMVTKR